MMKRVFCDDHEWVGDEGQSCRECDAIWSDWPQGYAKDPAPQPPALGGEPEVKRYSLIGKCLSENSQGEGGRWMEYAQHRNTVAPLLAEIERLKVLSVTKIMIEVVPGHHGMGEEVYAKSVADIQKVFSKFVDDAEALEADRDTLKARCEELEGMLRRISKEPLLDTAWRTRIRWSIDPAAKDSE